jgi:uracil-DNA glycosylase
MHGSAFIDFIRAFEAEWYEDDNVKPHDIEGWRNAIAYTDLYKLAPQSKESTTPALRSQQMEICRKILEHEIHILKPKVVLMLTSGWEQPFLEYLNGGNFPACISSRQWQANNAASCSIQAYKIKDRFFLATHHPQGKYRDNHLDAITSICHELEKTHGLRFS